MVNEQSGGKAGGGGGGGGKSNSEPGGGKDVIELTEANWRKKVGNNEKGILVEFYAPWCGHCKSLSGPWADAATQLKVTLIAPWETRLTFNLAAKISCFVGF